VGGRVLGCAVNQTMGDRHRPVGKDGEDLKQLQQAPRSSARSRARGPAGAPRRAVCAWPAGRCRRGDRGGLVVQLVHRDVEPADRQRAERGEQAAAIRAEQLVEDPLHLVVVEQPCPTSFEAEERCIVAPAQADRPYRGWRETTRSRTSAPIARAEGITQRGSGGR